MGRKIRDKIGDNVMKTMGINILGIMGPKFELKTIMIICIVYRIIVI